jgi:hypothetical protein
MSVESCPERRALAHAVVAAITETYRTQAAYDIAKQKGLRDLDTPARVLVKAMSGLREAERALQEHIEHHECSNLVGMR